MYSLVRVGQGRNPERWFSHDVAQLVTEGLKLVKRVPNFAHFYFLKALYSFLQVFYLDFGNTEWISARDTFEILPQFLHLPFQAIECFLHNVEPVGDTDTWSKESK